MADEVFASWTSGDVHRMLAAESLDTNPVDRHYLLLSLVRALYSRRQAPTSRAAFLLIAGKHLAEMKELIAALKSHDVESRRRSIEVLRERSLRKGETTQVMELALEGAVPMIETFLLMVRVLCEDERYEEAMAVWRHAVEVGYLSPDELQRESKAIDRRRTVRETKNRGKSAAA